MTDKTEIAALVERITEAADRFSITSHAYALSPHECRAAAALLTSLAEERERMREALEKARDQFRGYATLHHQKGTPDGDAKALTNASFADMCAAALAPTPASKEPEHG